MSVGNNGPSPHAERSWEASCVARLRSTCRARIGPAAAELSAPCLLSLVDVCGDFYPMGTALGVFVGLGPR